jgi:hypothetical protein
MFKRLLSLGFIVLGTVVSIVSLVADPLGFGSGPDVVGWKQLTGMVVGIFIAIFGLWLSQTQTQTKAQAQAESNSEKETNK